MRKERMLRELEDLGLNVRTENGEFKDFPDVMSDLVKKWSKTKPEMREILCDILVGDDAEHKDYVDIDDDPDDDEFDAEYFGDDE